MTDQPGYSFTPEAREIAAEAGKWVVLGLLAGALAWIRRLLREARRRRLDVESIPVLKKEIAQLRTDFVAAMQAASTFQKELDDARDDIDKLLGSRPGRRHRERKHEEAQEEE